MKKAFLKCVVWMGFVLLLAKATSGKESISAILKGSILDPSGALIPRAYLSLKNIPSGRLFQAVSDEEGHFIFRGLTSGSYALSMSLEGFKPYLQEGLWLQEGVVRQFTVQLEIQPLLESLTVQAKTPPHESQWETRVRNHEEFLEIREARESGAKDVGEALSKLEGMWKIRKAGIANDVVLRGFQQDNVNIVMDGLRIYGACPNNMDPSVYHADFAEISQVEVIKGPFNVRDQGSLGGIVTLKSPVTPDGLHLIPRFIAGSYSFINASLVASFARQGWDGTAGYSFRGSDPYHDGSGKSFTRYANYRDTAQTLDAFNVATFWFKAGASLSPGDRIQLAYARQQGGRTLYPYLQMDAIYDNADRLSATYASRSWAGFLKQVRLESYYSAVRHWMTDELRSSSLGAPKGYGMGALASTRAVGGRVEAEFNNFTAGLDGYRRNWNTLHNMRMAGSYRDQASLPDVNLWAAGTYAEYRKQLWSRLRLHAGVRLDYAADQARSQALSTDLYWAYNGTRSLSSTSLHPSGNLWVTYPLPRNVELFAGAGHSVRLPDPQERYFSLKRSGSDWVGNPTLALPQNNEIDIGINYRGRRFYVRPTFFYSDLTNFIWLHSQPKINPVPGVPNSVARSYVNVKGRMAGGELSYSVGLSREWLLLGGLSYTRGTKAINPQAKILDHDFAEMPPLKSRTALRFGRKKFFGELEGLAVNAQNHVDADLLETRTPGYFILSFKGGIRFEKMRFTAGVENLFNRYYYEHFSYQRDPFRSGVRVPEPGRTLYVVWEYRF